MLTKALREHRSSLRPLEYGRPLTLAAWKIKIVTTPTDDGDIVTLVSEGITAYKAYFRPVDGESLRVSRCVCGGQGGIGCADGRMTAHVYSLVDIVFVTCNMSANESLVQHFRLNVLFVDEAGQAIDKDIAIPLMSFESDLQAVFLSSDDLQLPPIVVSSGANEFSTLMETSLFKRVRDMDTAATTDLRYPYRFQAVHCNWISATLYKGLLSSRINKER